MESLDATGFVSRKEFYQALSSVFLLLAFIIIGGVPILRERWIGKFYGAISALLFFFYMFKSYQAARPRQRG